MPYLGVPFGTYGHSPSFVLGKDGSIYTTNVGNMGNKKPWRGRVWKFTPGLPGQQVYEAPGAHLALHVVNRELLCVWIDTKGKIGYEKIAGYLPLDTDVSGVVVNIDASAMAELKMQIQQAEGAVGKSQKSIEALDKTLDRLEAKIAALEGKLSTLEKRPTAQGANSVNTEEVASIVWAKLWDSIYLLRMGMNAGFSSDVNVAGWINDLTAFIRKVSNGK